MWARWIAIAILCLILYSLGSAAYYMLFKRDEPRKMAKALTWRISLSLILFAAFVVGAMMGWINPHQLQLFAIHS